MAKVLVLCSHDSHQAGHGWSLSKRLETEGHKVCFVVLHRNNSAETENYFFDGISRWKNFNLIRLLYIYFDSFIISKLMRPDPVHCFNTSGLYGISAKRILKKCPFVPDIIQITWTTRFLTPKTIRELYNLTGAKIIFTMNDEAILAGCHYPANCNGYVNGCKDCPGVKHFKCLPRRFVAMKERNWTDMPAEIIGTKYDIALADKTPFLKHMIKFGDVTIPELDIVISKKDARVFFGIADDDYVIFAGANNIVEKRKGFDVLVKAINLFASENKSSRPITLLLMGHIIGDFPFVFDDRINIVIRDFLPQTDFLKAYYACDVYASPTLADSGPMMVNYSIACGRPVIAFPVGVAVDLVVPGKTGYMAEFGNARDFAEGLSLFYKKSEDELSKYEIACKTHINSFANS